jgi:hypothetical protein
MATPLSIALNSVTTTLNQLIETTFPDECAISRPSFTLDAYGGQTPSYATVSGMSSIGCSWAPLSSTSAMEYVRTGQINEVCTYKISMASAVGGSVVDIKAKDRVVVATRGIEPARTFEVKGIIRNAGLPLLVLCTLEE